MDLGLVRKKRPPAITAAVFVFSPGEFFGFGFGFCVALEGASRARLPPAAVDILSFRFSPFGLNKNWSWEFLQKSHNRLSKPFQNSRRVKRNYITSE